MKYWKQEAGGRPLAAIFATQQMKGKVSTQSTDAEVESALRAEVQSAVDNSFNVVRNRIDKFGVAQPNIQKLEGQSGRIMVEMPGIKEPERVRKLLQGSANLEFWETYNSNEITPLLAQLNQRYAITGGDAAPVDTAAVAEEAAPADTAAATTGDLAAKLAKKDDKADSKAVEAAKKQNPLFSIFQPTQGNTLAIVGYANARDTAEINKIIFSDLARQIMPAELKLRWGAKAEDFGGQNTKGDIFELYALKITEPSGRAPLEGDVITNAKDDFDQMGHPSVSMQMNSDGARRWSQITKQNIGKAVAIVLDDAVYSAPRILTQIDGGNSQITGNFTIEDTKDLANTLNSGKMPAPTRIVQEEVVGPSLGDVIHRCIHPADDLHDSALRLHPRYPLRYCPAVQPVLHTGYSDIVPGCPDDAWYRRYRTDTGYGCGCQRAYLRAYQGGAEEGSEREGSPQQGLC